MSGLPTKAAPAGAQTGIPSSLYRLQISDAFPLAAKAAGDGRRRAPDNATNVVAYLNELGIAAVYTSPLNSARGDKGFGYHISDTNAIDPRYAGPEGLGALRRELDRYGMGLVMDFVPNHMFGDYSNKWWRDVLTFGHDSRYAKFFDIRWEDVNGSPLLIPIFGSQRGPTIDNREVKLGLDEDNRFLFQFYAHRFPINPQSWLEIFKTGAPELIAWQSTPLKDILEECKKCSGEAKFSCFDRLTTAINQELAANPVFREELEKKIAWYNTPGEQSNAAFRNLHDRQNYTLEYWRAGFGELQYRRFFDINELVGLRVEDPEVFDEALSLLFRLVKNGCVNGIRLDHVDGLFDPAKFFAKLREGIAQRLSHDHPAFPVWAEKILVNDEKMPPSWGLDGDTGYHFMNQVNGLFIRRDSKTPFESFFAEITGDPRSFSYVLKESKELVIRWHFRAEVAHLARELEAIAGQSDYTSGYKAPDLEAAIELLLAAMPAYRTYFSETETGETTVSSPQDKKILDTAERGAISATNPPVAQDVFNFVRRVIDRTILDEKRGHNTKAVVAFSHKFQQCSGAIMAKAMEDTAFYRYYALASLNEVGGDPERFGTSAADFHAENLYRRAYFPYTMLDTTTHDTKRSEDARMRINVLSHFPEQWMAHVKEWMTNNASHKSDVEMPDQTKINTPSPRLEYLIYQTLVAAWPLELTDQDSPALPGFKDRIKVFLDKAVSEAKLTASWDTSEMNQQMHQYLYREAVKGFVDRILDDPAFFASIVQFQEKIAHAAATESLAQTVLKMSSPGIPVIYQGSELWDLRLVDPDNRRPVDFGKLQKMIARTYEPRTDLKSTLCSWETGEVKLRLIQMELEERQNHADLYTKGLYIPLTEVDGTNPEGIVAFMRQSDDRTAVVIAPLDIARKINPRRPLDASKAFNDKASVVVPLKGGTELENLITGEKIMVGDGGKISLRQAFANFPVAHLVVSARPEAINAKASDFPIPQAA